MSQKIIAGLVLIGFSVLSYATGQTANEPIDKPSMSGQIDKKRDPVAFAEEFGLVIGPMTEEVRKELNYRFSDGVPVFEVIGETSAEEAGIKPAR